MDLKILSGTANYPLAQKIALQLGMPLVDVDFWEHPDQEEGLQIRENVRGCDLFIIQPTSPPQTSRHLVQLAKLNDAASRASAARITNVIPYFGYQRQDRKDKARVPISSALAMKIIGVSFHGDVRRRALLVDLHAEQLEVGFPIQIDHLTARPVFIEYFAETLGIGADDLVVASPDAGGGKRARRFAQRLSNHPLAFIDKSRDADGNSEALNLIGDVAGKHVLLVDDIVDTGGSLMNAAKMLQGHGARDIYACATHGVLSTDAAKRLAESKIKQLVVTDTIDIPKQKIGVAKDALHILSVAPLVADAIRRIHDDASISALFD